MISKSVSETEKAAQEVAISVKHGARGATVIALSGNLGSGKTTFTKAFAEAFGVLKNEVTSPTFVIMKSYDLEGKKFDKFVHIDAYRLEKKEELERLGWNELLMDSGNLILIEWPENVEGALPKDAYLISFKFIDENTREIVLSV